jgi:hypothetical protein
MFFAFALLALLASEVAAQAACGCANSTALCGQGNTCRDNKCQKFTPATPPPGAADGTPICVRAGGECCGNGQYCTSGSVCHNNSCTPVGQCPRDARTCADKPCAPADTCLDEAPVCKTAPCPSFTCRTPLPCDSNPCGSDELCENDQKECVTTPCPQFKCTKAVKCGCADPAARCGQGKTCRDNKCQPLTRPNLPPGVLDGTPGCIRIGGECCGSGYTCSTGQVCESNMCVDSATCAVTCASNPCAKGEKCIDDKKECLTTPCPQYRCEAVRACTEKSCAADEFCTEDPKECVTTPCPQFKCTKAKPCGCADPSAKCGQGNTCANNKCQPLQRPTLPAGVADGTPACLRGGGECCGSGSVCSSNQVCESSKCVDKSTCSTPPADTCKSNPCAPDQICIDEPKACDTTPCPQYKCEALVVCGCANPSAKCGAGKTCKENKCQPMPSPVLPVGVLDGSPACVRAGGECCGVGFVCSESQVCQSGECIEKSKCPAPGTCWTCATAGIKGYFDGCNSCGCDEKGMATCTEKACIASVPDAKKCERQCDGFLTEDDGACGRCTCVNGAKTKCSNAGTEKCNAQDNGGRDETPGAASGMAVAMLAVIVAFISMI